MTGATRSWTQVPPYPSSFPPMSLVNRHPLQLIWIPLSLVYINRTSLYPALCGREDWFERVCVAVEDNARAIKNEEEGCWEAQAAVRTKKACESPPQLWTKEWRYFNFYHGCHMCAVLSYLTNVFGWAWNYQLLYSGFNSVAYLHSGHIPISSSLVIYSGNQVYGWICIRFIQWHGIFPSCWKPPMIHASDTTIVAILTFWTQSFREPKGSRIETGRSVSRRKMSPNYTGLPPLL